MCVCVCVCYIAGIIVNLCFYYFSLVIDFSFNVFNVFSVIPVQEMKILVQGFTRLLRKASKDKPLVLILDSLDHLDTSDGGRQLEWLPRQLPANVKIILSMRPDEKYGVFPRCKVSKLRVCDDDCCFMATFVQMLD